jgi:hypothetical protein
MAEWLDEQLAEMLRDPDFAKEYWSEEACLRRALTKTLIHVEQQSGLTREEMWKRFRQRGSLLFRVEAGGDHTVKTLIDIQAFARAAGTEAALVFTSAETGHEVARVKLAQPSKPSAG